MNKKIIIPLIIILIAIGFIFFTKEKKGDLELLTDNLERSPRKEFSVVLEEDIWPIYGKLWDLHQDILAGEISQEEETEKLSFFENMVAELIIEYGIKTEVDELIARRKTIEELLQRAEPRIITIDFQLEGIIDYFIQQYGVDINIEEVKEIKEAMILQKDLWDFTKEIWKGELDKEELDKKIIAYEDRLTEMIVKYNIEEDIKEFMTGVEMATEEPPTINLRLENILIQLQAVEMYLVEKKTIDK